MVARSEMGKRRTTRSREPHGKSPTKQTCRSGSIRLGAGGFLVLGEPAGATARQGKCPLIGNRHLPRPTREKTD